MNFKKPKNITFWVANWGKDKYPELNKKYPAKTNTITCINRNDFYEQLNEWENLNKGWVFSSFIDKDLLRK
jgi:hypothetical protein